MARGKLGNSLIYEKGFHTCIHRDKLLSFSSVNMIDSSNENVFVLYFHSKRSKIKSLFTFHYQLIVSRRTECKSSSESLSTIELTCSEMTFIDSLKFRCCTEEAHFVRYVVTRSRQLLVFERTNSTQVLLFHFSENAPVVLWSL